MDDLQRQEEGVLEGFKDDLVAHLTELGNPKLIYYTSWALAQPEGKLVRPWKVESGELKEDLDCARISRVWSFIFPGSREDYLVERTWRRMLRLERRQLALDIVTYADEEDIRSTYQTASVATLPDYNPEYVLVMQAFKDRLKGEAIAREILQACDRLQGSYGTGAAPAEFSLKVARTLKHKPDFNSLQVRGIDDAFSAWMQNESVRTILGGHFADLYCDETGGVSSQEFAGYPLEARRYLTAWQNLSLIAPWYHTIKLHFLIPDPTGHGDLRYCVACFYDQAPHVHETYDAVGLLKEAHSNHLTRVYGADVGQAELPNDASWRKMKEANAPVWNACLAPTLKHMREDNNKRNEVGRFQANLDSLLEMAGSLSTVAHEARRCRFAFVIGTEQVWPAVEEVLSLRFYDPALLAGSRFEPHLYKSLCEANYSIFQCPTVAGFLNSASGEMRIVRLRSPSMEEMRKLDDPVSDTDDHLCWAITKVFEDTNGSERALVVSTEGDGRVHIYGLSDATRRGELLLIWDTRKGKLDKAIPDKDMPLIKKALGLIGVGEGSGEFGKLLRAIRKISMTPGEGAALIVAPDKAVLDRYLASMELLRPSWIESLGLEDPQYMMKSAFIMDGACVITSSRIWPRQVVYPHVAGLTSSWGMDRLVERDELRKKGKSMAVALSGKGSKTHGCANFSTLKEVNPDLGNALVMVISISADGPIKVWPDYLLCCDDE